MKKKKSFYFDFSWQVFKMNMIELQHEATVISNIFFSHSEIFMEKIFYSGIIFR